MIEINNSLLEKVCGINTAQPFKCKNLSLLFQDLEDSLTFLDDLKFVNHLGATKNITTVLITEKLSKSVDRKDMQFIICNDPRYSFFFLYNYVERNKYTRTPSSIDKSASIHQTSFVSEYNVTIGKNVIIEPNATILSDVYINDDTIIRPGVVLGTEGFEHKRTLKGILSVFHSGKVIIGSQVEVGANTCIDKGHFGIDTIIGDETKMDNLVHIAHSVNIGKRCLIAAGVVISGTVKIGNDVWVGPNSTIVHQIVIEDNAFITLGSVVAKNVRANEWVTGNFAIPHSKFLELFRKNIK